MAFENKRNHISRQPRREWASALEGAGAEGQHRATPTRAAAPETPPLRYGLDSTGDICPYGIDPWLWLTHFGKLVTTFLISSYADTLELSRAAIYGQTMARVLFFVNVKAVLNTIMVYTGWKRPGAFKVTQKAGGAANPAGEVAVGAPPAPVEDVERENGGPTVPVSVLYPTNWQSGQCYSLHMCYG